LGTLMVDVVEPATRSLHTAVADPLEIGGQMLSEVQLLWSIEHLPGVTCGRQSLSAVHDLVVSMLHLPPSGGQSLTLVHASPELEQVWPNGGQPESSKQAVVRSLSHLPGSVGQSAGLVQAANDALHAPGTMGHSASLWQSDATTEHWPTGGQLAATRQAAASMLHAPATVGHCASVVQAACVTVH